MSQLRTAVEGVLPSVRDDLERLVRIRSVSADPAAAGEVRASAEAVAELARGAGAAEVEVLAADGGAPAVIASWPAPDGAPTVLLYAHHDVQPSEAAGAWASDPFVPEERDGRLYGRGAADDKAGIAAHLAALRAFDGTPPVGVVLFVEGEEEIGSPTFTPFLKAYRDRLAADVIVVADSMNWTIEQPALTTSLRGLSELYVEVEVLDRSVHSGMGGGPVIDALTALCRLVATLHDSAGDVAVAGLVTATASDVDYTEQRFRSETGLLDDVTLAGTGSLPDRLWAKPAIDVVGIDAPTVADAANILLHRARAKLSMRLAPAQDPRAALDALRQHLLDHVEHGARVTLTDGAVGAGCSLDTTTDAFAAARAAFEEAFEHPVAEIGIGGSIPFIAEFAEVFPDATVLVTGVEDPASAAHGVDESLHLEQFAKVCLAEALLLERLAPHQP